MRHLIALVICLAAVQADKDKFCHGYCIGIGSAYKGGEYSQNNADGSNATGVCRCFDEHDYEAARAPSNLPQPLRPLGASHNNDNRSSIRYESDYSTWNDAGAYDAL